MNVDLNLKDSGYNNVKKVPLLFAILCSISVASYALCTPLMTKVIEFHSVSVTSLVGMMCFSILGALLGDCIKEKRNISSIAILTGGGIREKRINSFIGVVIGVLFALVGVGIWGCEAMNLFHLPGPMLAVSLTGDSLFFTFTYVLSDVFSEVFGYKASRITANVSAMFAVFVALICKGMTLISGPDWASDNDFSFSFIYGGGIYVTIIGVLIYAIGDWANDFMFKILKSCSNHNTFGSYSIRSIGSSLVGKTVDLTLFSLLVFVPLSNDWICEKLGIISWGMTPMAILGNYLLGIALQITTEVALSPIGFNVSRVVQGKIDKIVEEERNNGIGRVISLNA